MKKREWHGATGSKTYKVWAAMRQRCKRNPYYVQRGIVVCPRWGEFGNFLADMGEVPQGMTIEREDNDKGYEPGNCVWATMKEQCRNRKSNVMLTFSGATKCLRDWAIKLGINPGTILSRLRKGHPIERVLSKSSFHGNNRHTAGRVFGEVRTDWTAP